MKQSESIVNLAKALAVVQGKVQPVPKDATNPHFRNRYASLDAIMETVRPLLAANGLAIVQGGGAPVSNVDGAVTGVAVETMLVHTSGEYVASTITLPLDKGTAQAVGSAISYGRRYGVSALLALSTEDDDDGNAASAQRAARSEPARAPLAAGNGASGTAHAKRMPFGKHKGTPLGEVDSDALIATIDWCQRDTAKFGDLIAACHEVLADRGVDEAEIPY